MKPLAVGRMMVFTPSNPGIINVQHGEPKPGLPLAAGAAHEVHSYRELLSKLAALRYYNKRFRLLYRGQGRDWRTLAMTGKEGRSSLYPSILRYTGTPNRTQDLERRFERLLGADRLIREELPVGTLWKSRVLRWALIQHYEIAPTPFFDVTSSVDRALAFAIGCADSGQSANDDPHLFVFAFPHLTGTVSVSAESETQVVDLTQACPPQALRPHYQEALVASDYPIVESVEMSHGRNGKIGNSFACRLIAKFRLSNTTSWGAEGLCLPPSSLLYPDAEDEWFSALSRVRTKMSTRR